MEDKLSFDFIALSKEEEKLLAQIKEKNIPASAPSGALDRLIRHNLASHSMVASVKGTKSYVDMNAVLITDYGRDYLAYVHKLKADRQRNLRQSILVALLSAALGALFSQPLWSWIHSLLSWLNSLFT